MLFPSDGRARGTSPHVSPGRRACFCAPSARNCASAGSRGVDFRHIIWLRESSAIELFFPPWCSLWSLACYRGICGLAMDDVVDRVTEQVLDDVGKLLDQDKLDHASRSFS